MPFFLKDNVKHPIVLPAPKPPQNPLHPVQAVNTQNAPKVEAPTDLFDLLNIEEPIQTGGSVAPLVSSDDQSWDAFQCKYPWHYHEIRDCIQLGCVV